MKSLSCVQLFVTPWTAAFQAPLSLGFSRQEDWSGVPLPTLAMQILDGHPPKFLEPVSYNNFMCPSLLSLSLFPEWMDGWMDGWIDRYRSLATYISIPKAHIHPMHFIPANNTASLGIASGWEIGMAGVNV